MCPVLRKKNLYLLDLDLVVFATSSHVKIMQGTYIIQGPSHKGLGTTCPWGLCGICTEPKVTVGARVEWEDLLLSLVTSPEPRASSEPPSWAQYSWAGQLNQQRVLRSPDPALWFYHLRWKYTSHLSIDSIGILSVYIALWKNIQ